MKSKNKILLITALLFVITAVVFLILGFSLAGANVWAWFGSKWAMIFYIVFGIYALIIIYLVVGDWIKRL